MSGTCSPTSRRGRRVAADEGWVRCEMKLRPRGWGGHVLLLLALARSQFLRLRKLLLAVVLGGVAVNHGRRGNVRYMGGFLAQTLNNLKSPSPGSGCLTQKSQIIIRMDCEMGRGERDARLNNILFGSPSNASSSFSKSVAIVFSGYFFKT